MRLRAQSQDFRGECLDEDKQYVQHLLYSADYSCISLLLTVGLRLMSCSLEADQIRGYPSALTQSGLGPVSAVPCSGYFGPEAL